jgi:hypothetical protein
MIQKGADGALAIGAGHVDDEGGEPPCFTHVQKVPNAFQGIMPMHRPLLEKKNDAFEIDGIPRS